MTISPLLSNSLSSEIKESDIENSAFGKTFTKPLNDVLKIEDIVENTDYSSMYAVNEEEELYEEEDNWEKYRLPDILHDTQAKTFWQEGKLCCFLKLSRSV